jgi:hemerythrin-like metal-binding protein
VGLIEWRDEFSIGLPDVDHEHREMISMINALHESLGPAVDGDRVVAALGEIHARIAAHFALEEREMHRLDYIAFLDHKADHERLLDDILDIMDSVEATAGYDPVKFGRRLSKWFTEHFRTHDARLHRWLVGRN